jgi:hypothetical protein
VSIPTTVESRWPSRLAYCAAMTFTLASGGTNLLYGWNKGTDPISSLIWAAISVGVTIAFMLSWPALIHSANKKQWTNALIAVVSLSIFGGYSVVAALGSAKGGRENAALEEKDATDKRKKAQKAYDDANTELETMKSGQKIRAVGELEALLAGQPKGPCKQIVRVGQGLRQVDCAPSPKVTALSAELGRAKRKVELEASLKAAADELKATQSTKQANSDAAALVDYLAAVGINTTVDRVNKLLVLLAVLIVECGGGLALAVGVSLSAVSGAPSDQMSTKEITVREVSSGGSGDKPLTSSPVSTPTGNLPLAPSGQLLALPIAASTNRDTAGLHLLALLQRKGGILIGGQRRMAKALGWSKSWTHRVLHTLAESGHVQLSTDSRGTVVRLTI